MQIHTSLTHTIPHMQKKMILWFVRKKFVSYDSANYVQIQFLILRFSQIDFDFQGSSAPSCGFSFCVWPVSVIPRYIAAITITATTNTNTHQTIVYFDNNCNNSTLDVVIFLASGRSSISVFGELFPDL